MGFSPVTLWSTATHSCVLRQTDGQWELLLYHDGRLTRLHTCKTPQTARELAHEWQLALSETPEQ